jgi:DNA-binding FadR family transcriptional regulator
MRRRYEDVMRELVEAIAGGEYAQGAWLPSLNELRSRFGAGREVLREALRGLEERGLIVVHPATGQTVRDREYWALRAPDVLRACIAREPQLLTRAIDARTVVELEAAARICERAPDADLGLLAGLVETMERSPAELVATDAWFHRTLALLSGNAVLAKLSEPLHLPLAELRQARAPERDRTVLAHHRRILEGLTSREPELAREAIASYARALTRWLGGRS